MARRKKGTGKKDFVLALVLTSLAVFVFVAVYYVRNPKNIFRSKAGAPLYIYTCNSMYYDWDPTRTLVVDMDDAYSGPLTSQYLSLGHLFDYNLDQGVGLNKVPVSNTLNPENGYAVTVSSGANPFSNTISSIQSTTESSMILQFPNPVETVSFQMQYGEPFDLSDTNREVPVWGVEIGVYIRENDGSDFLALRQAWNVTPIATYDALRSVCFTMGRNNKYISKIVLFVPNEANTRGGALPPEKLSLDNFKVQVPSKWEAPEEPSEPTPTVSEPTPTASENPGTCVCLPNGRVKYDYCNDDYGYAPVCGTDGCECVM